MDRKKPSLKEGECVSILQNQTQMTTEDAASMLNVSAEFLSRLLEEGEIPYHLVGTQPRILAQDLFKFKEKRDKRRRELLSKLWRAEVKEGLYDRVLAPDED